jgi:hypothetical protein
MTGVVRRKKIMRELHISGLKHSFFDPRSALTGVSFIKPICHA